MLLIEILLQIDDAVRSKAGDRLAGARIERHEPVAGRNVEDSLLLPIGPIREAAADSWRGAACAARAFVLAVHPQQLAGRGVQGDHRAPRAGRRKQPAVDHQRRRLEVEFRPRPEVVGLESPGDLELAEVAGVDLVERRRSACCRDRRRKWAIQCSRRWPCTAVEMPASVATMINLRNIVRVLSIVNFASKYRPTACVINGFESRHDAGRSGCHLNHHFARSNTPTGDNEIKQAQGKLEHAVALAQLQHRASE